MEVNPLSANHNEKSSAFVVCWNGLEAFPAKSVDPDQTAPTVAVRCGSTLFVSIFKICKICQQIFGGQITRQDYIATLTRTIHNQIIRNKSYYDSRISQIFSGRTNPVWLEQHATLLNKPVQAKMYSKTCAKRPLKIDKTKILMTKW